MKKFLILTSALCLSASLQAGMSPTNPFYNPKKDNFTAAASLAWNRAEDTTSTDTTVSFYGAYGLTDNLSILGAVVDNAGNLPNIPEVGVKYTGNQDALKWALKGTYGFGKYSSDDLAYNYFDFQGDLGYDIKDITLGAFLGYTYDFGFSRGYKYGLNNNQLDHNAYTYGGFETIYQVNQKTEAMLEYGHSFYTRTQYEGYPNIKNKNKADWLTARLSYEFKCGAFVTPYFTYSWNDKDLTRNNRYLARDEKVLGVNLAVEF